MKKNSAVVPVTLILLILVLRVTAVENTFGLKMGSGLSTWWGQDADMSQATKKQKIIKALAGYYRAALTDRFSIQMEVMYTGRGIHYEHLDSELGNSRETVQLDYLDLPLLTKLTIPDRYTRIEFYSGPVLSCITSATHILETVGSKTSEDIKSSMQPFDLGFTFGGAMGVIVRSGTIIYELRYTVGLINNQKRLEGVQPNIRNGVFHFLMGYEYNF